MSLISCQEDEAKEENLNELSFSVFKKKWTDSNLNFSLLGKKESTTCYLFSKNEINDLQENSRLEKLRFVLGLTNGKIDIKTQGVDINGEGLGIINSEIYFEKSLDESIVKLGYSNQKFISNNSISTNHLLNPQKAFEYINKWNKRSNETKILSNIVSYDNNRIKHFSIEKEVINEISHFTNFNYLGVILGVNPEGKLTTVLVGLDENKNIILPSSLSKTGESNGGIYDFTQPCPSTCD